jgi:hypothetical protein
VPDRQFAKFYFAGLRHCHFLLEFFWDFDSLRFWKVMPSRALLRPRELAEFPKDLARPAETMGSSESQSNPAATRSVYESDFVPKNEQGIGEMASGTVLRKGSYQGIASAMPSSGTILNGFSR